MLGLVGVPSKHAAAFLGAADELGGHHEGLVRGEVGRGRRRAGHLVRVRVRVRVWVRVRVRLG